MVVSLDEMKNYLRVDTSEDDDLISALIKSSEKMCLDIARKEEDEIIGESFEEYKVAVLYAAAYLYEHREEADHHELTITLRSMLFGVRKAGF
ncbi:TPA: phage gp6-like head-tail connector protein [Streptococcus pyogenes]|uniref:head-tail connector protein n=1 Tax=Bacilli TaxID=91061 RepID=UPI0007C4742D|nr:MULTISPECIES: head-tail connector protein [Bacilli]HEN0108231.1 phage gp6-like head-tail connector protein [Streptococcus agalactiae]AXI26769.1 phage gp6-like head-tail connector protein [Gemella sp. ND 6198]OAC90941.1 AraC family transcriptional regulator [Streptococcus pyogenes]OCX02003.1 AraC family transcriptional regulator [Streptococcus dysgalactiae subsp. equisimilis]QCK67743.1 phage gp6-like head-tail connector protein [Streptococcus pyogenes]